MTAVVHCLRTWRHYLRGSRFVVKTDNIATSYFQSQKKLSPKQARWQDFLAEFYFVLEYKPGRNYVVADALSRKAELAALKLEELASVSHCKGDLHNRIRAVLEKDPLTQTLLQQVREGKTRK